MSSNHQSAMSIPASRKATPHILKQMLGLNVALLCFAMLLGAIAFALSGRSSRLSDEHILNYHLYHEDLGAAALIALTLAGAWLWIRTRNPTLLASGIVEASWAAVLSIAAASAVIAYLGTSWIFLGSSLSMDEFMTEFDVRIFSTGQPMAPVPAEWSPYLKALQPLYRLIAPGETHWASNYLPVGAAIRTLFAWVGDVALASPSLAAVAVVLLYLVAQQLFPKDRESQLVSVLLLATSMQFLITAMTPYAMTAHLTLNLAWLWLVLRDRPWSHAAAAPVTLAACGLHQLVFHPLFAAPFLVVMAFQRRWWLVVYYAALFAVAGLFWISYSSFILPAIQPTVGPDAALESALPSGGYSGALAFLHLAWETIAAAKLNSVFEAGMHVFRFMVWQNPLASVLLLAAAATWKRWPPAVVALAAGILLTLVFMSVLVPNPGHGRGYRYLHGLLGSTALLAAVGWQVLRDRFSVPLAQMLAVLWIAVVASMVGLLPLRAEQTQALIRPYIVASEAIRRSGADVVLVDRDGLWFGTDLVRNDPFLQTRPLIMDLRSLDEAELRQLCGRYQVQIFDRSHPAASDIRGSTQAETWSDNRLQRAVLRSIGCGTPVVPSATPPSVGSPGEPPQVAPSREGRGS